MKRFISNKKSYTVKVFSSLYVQCIHDVKCHLSTCVMIIHFLKRSDKYFHLSIIHMVCNGKGEMFSNTFFCNFNYYEYVSGRNCSHNFLQL